VTLPPPPERLGLVEPVLGFLNFASNDPGAPLLAAVNRLYLDAEQRTVESELLPWEAVREDLRAGLAQLARSSPAFARSEQAEAVLALLYEDLLPTYRSFHRDLLFHQPDEGLFQAFFVGKAMGRLLDQGPSWQQTSRIVEGALSSLNDYIGFRPVATLETQKIEPYAHEWVAPLPLYVRGAGAAAGPYREVVEKALEILRNAPIGILRQAQFSPERIETLALDPRAYDFDHPVNKRPNYHFGLWDPTKVSPDGYFSRFIVQQVTMDALAGRIRQRQDLELSETVFEAASVLAGIVLMASGISGAGPGSIDSQTSVADLLPRIAGFRDDFYRHLITQISGRHLARLDQEAKQLKQPFAGARQHLNAELAARRASQLERAHLARIYSRMGYEVEARETLRHVQTPSARMNCAMDCILFASQRSVRQGKLSEALGQLQELRYTLVRGIECGALVDPWNILGFDGQFPLFSNADGSVHDHRVQEIVSLMELTYQAYSRILNEATARGDEKVAKQADHEFRDATAWWRQYAAHEVASVESADPEEAYKAARHVAEALRVWHEGGAATGDVKFWAEFVDLFDSPRAYAMVIDVLLEKRDFVASQALLMHWLSRAADVGLERGDTAFHEQAAIWLHRLRREAGPLADFDAADDSGDAGDGGAATDPEAKRLSLSEVWRLTVRFFDYLEPNAGDYWKAPRFDPTGEASRKTSTGPDWEYGDREDDEDDRDEDSPFSAAWDEVVFRDSADDGMEGAIYESGPSSDDGLEREAREIQKRLSFLNTLASLWKLAVMTPAAALQDGTAGSDDVPTLEQFREPLQRWLDIAIQQRKRLLALADQIHSYRLPAPGPEQESMVDYDRRRYYKESALEQAIHAAIEAADASRLFLAANGALAFAGDARERDAWERSADFLDADERLAIRVLSAALGRDVARIRELWPELIETLRTKSLLYVPVGKGGDIRQIVDARIWHRTVIDLLSWLPRLGLLTETCELLETAREMERNNPVGPGAVTEYDELFRSGYLALVQTLVRCSRSWTPEDSQAFLEQIEEEARANAVASEPDEEETPAAGRKGKRNAKAEAEAEANRSFLDPNVSAKLDEQPLVEALQRALEPLLMCWLQHSRTLRLSVLERISDPRTWERTVQFIQAYGKDLFTQKFFHQPNLRAILHQGVKNWLDKLKEMPGAEAPFKLLRDYEEGTLDESAIDSMTMVLETILENYPEYRDYNSTTTQSDRGEMLFTLLDFLRLRTRYDRLAWNLKPVVWTHEILVRAKLDEAAHAWRESLRRRIDDEAKTYLTQLGELQKKYAMRIPTVSDRLSERFMRPLEIDQLRALVRPAMTIDDTARAAAEFAKLRDIAERFVQSPSGVGLDLPRWLLSLEEETEKVRQPLRSKERYETRTVLRVEMLSLAEIKRQMDAWKRLE
jgi:hypothetical protein